MREIDQICEPWPKATKGLAEAIAKIAANKVIEESCLAFRGYSFEQKKNAMAERRQELRNQAQQIISRRKA